MLPQAIFDSDRMNSSISDPFIHPALIPARATLPLDQRSLGLHTLGTQASAAIEHLPTQSITAKLLNSTEALSRELWLTNTATRAGKCNGIHFRRSDILLFGVLNLDEHTLDIAANTSSLRAATEHAYREIFALLAAEGFRYLWRTWNYLPNIHGEECALERYRQFNVGRHDAFTHCARAIEESPAASALGTAQGNLSIAFIAGNIKPTRIENPRQLSAFTYPAQYGPRSPTFTRAVTVADATHEALFISGTASIVGHESKHPGDIAAQTRETLANMSALLEQANANSSAPPLTFAELSYRIYIRHAEDAARVRTQLDAVIGAAAHATYVQADICREDLLIEIEAFAVRALAKVTT